MLLKAKCMYRQDLKIILYKNFLSIFLSWLNYLSGNFYGNKLSGRVSWFADILGIVISIK